MLWSEDSFDDCCIMKKLLALLVVFCFLDIRGHTFDLMGVEGLGLVDDRWGFVGWVGRDRG